MGAIYKFETVKFKKVSTESVREVNKLSLDLTKLYYDLNADIVLIAEQFDDDIKNKIYEYYAGIQTNIINLKNSLQLLSKDIAEATQEIANEMNASDDE